MGKNTDYIENKEIFCPTKNLTAATPLVFIIIYYIILF